MSDEIEVTAASEDDLHEIELSDLLALQLSTIESVTIVPSFSIGTQTATDARVLVPLMSCTLHGKFGENDDETPISSVLAFDNLAFLAMRLGDALRNAADDIEAVSQGDLAPSHDRLEYATQCLASGAADLAAAASRIRELHVTAGPQIPVEPA